jgi:signal transduction histidine kinase
MALAVTELPVEVIAVGPIWVDSRQCPVVAEAVREALTNVVKYSNASRAFVFAGEDDGWLSVSTRDNGRGFVYNEAELRTSGASGIFESIKRPVEALGGRVRIIAAPDLGTEVEIRLPQPQGRLQHDG